VLPLLLIEKGAALLQCNVVSEGVHLAAGAATAADRKGCSFIAVFCE